MTDITRLLKSAAQKSDRAVIDQIVSALYPELHRLARSRLSRNRPISVLDTTAMVHETYERLCGSTLDANCRGQFMAYASQVMRSILVDFVRALKAERRGGDLAHVTLSTDLLDRHGSSDSEVERVHDALLALEDTDPDLRRVVEMKYFGGFNEREIAEAMGISERTVERIWTRARKLLRTLVQH